MVKKHLLTIAIAILLSSGSNIVWAQGLAVNSSGAIANSSAILDVSSSTQGALMPRMTSAQRTAISSPATGLLVYQTDGSSGFYYYNGSAWTSLNSPGGTASGDLSGSYPSPTLATTGVAAATYGSATTVPIIAVDSKGRITSASDLAVSGVTPAGAAGGNLGGTYPNPNIASLPAISGANLTSLPAGVLTGTLPAISGASITSINGSNISSGTMGTARLGTGTASSSTYLTGGNTWATPSGGGGGVSLIITASGKTGGGSPEYIGVGSTDWNNTSIGLGQYAMPVSCTIDAFYVYVKISDVPISGTNSYTGTIYKNGSATSSVVTFTLPSSCSVNQIIGIYSDATHTVSVSQGDLITVQWTQTNFTNGALAYVSMSIHAH